MGKALQLFWTVVIIGLFFFFYGIAGNVLKMTKKEEIKKIVPPAEVAYGEGKPLHGTVIEIPQGFLSNGDYFVLEVSPRPDNYIKMAKADTKVKILVPKWLIQQHDEPTHSKVLSDGHRQIFCRPYPGIKACSGLDKKLEEGDEITYYAMSRLFGANHAFLMGTWKE